jgi:deazaflavin-dependent oxidoreductase (nitroreductase family)
MTTNFEGEYAPSSWDWVKDQVEAYEKSGGTEANGLQGTDMKIVVLTTRGVKTGKIRKFALMRVEHDGEYALVASKGGMPEHPGWYHNVKAEPHVLLQDGPEPHEYVTRQVEGDEKAIWWERAVAAYPPYEEYQEKTDRIIPVLVATRVQA